ncbi:uncharacterized protein LOC119998175 isoform X2 [Tripterygium wilfordii]|uniref:uncharacterized protein LOC119998175 isoform X2 n=1 Tax=Tripterygium wilfordii TaxID=458696 RepID=UPI0018F81E10|nr:uncharacterized protein LOC119998175 isoform X2 [Tripterygium wilfordii]
MMEGKGSRENRTTRHDCGFTDVVFSWSLEQIFNENLYRDKVEKIPDTFESVVRYFNSYIFPFLEETRAQLCSSMEVISRAPYGEVIAFDESKPYGEKLYDIKIDYWRSRYSCRSKESYKTLPGDILVLADSKPETVSDLQRMGRTWTFATVTSIVDDENEDDSSSTSFKVKASVDPDVGDGLRKSLFVVFLINVTPSKRIWRSLHKYGNTKVIQEILCADSVIEKACDLCSVESEYLWDENCAVIRSSTLNESQTQAVVACLRLMHCNHKSVVKLIWGPPGTGKTKTVSVMLFTLFRMECRILTCAPTNVAITQVASKVLRMLKDSFQAECETNDSFCSLGDILLFGNKERLKVGAELEEIYLDYRVRQLAGCFGPLTGWRHCFSSMIDFLENCVSQYHIFVENELIKIKEKNDENETKGIECLSTKDMNFPKSFIKFVRERFRATVSPLRNCVSNFCTHIPKSYILEHNFEKMVYLISSLNSFGALLEDVNVSSDELEELFSDVVGEDFPGSLEGIRYMLHERRSECLSVLRILWNSLSQLKLPSVMNYGAIKDFCFQTASLIFCTASSSYKLHSIPMKPLSILVVDEAAQLKECESTIPLQLPGIRHAVLIGDVCQLPAMVESKASDEAGLGRSLFERLSSLGHSKNLLNMQYRMHPSISFFPNANFYHNQILDAPNVKMKNYERQYLPGKMFGPYSFINVLFGREEFDDMGRSRKNMIEVALVLKLLQNLHSAWIRSKQNLSVGVISPYSAQVVAIQEKLGHKYENSDGFAVKVKSIDGFQGGEEDIIILSTVRSNSGGSFEFISNQQRTNVALTRARHCLWILGNERILLSSESVWEALVRDAKNRRCFYNADDDKDLAKAILEVKKEFDQLDDLLNGDNTLFKNARWKVLFSDIFFKSFKRLASIRTKKSVLSLLLKLASGWRPKKRKVDSLCGGSSQTLKQFKVEGLYVVCSIDIIKESRFLQVLRVWDVLPLEDIPKLEKRLHDIFAKYTDDFINRCKEKSLEGDLEIPKTWLTSSNIVRFKNLTDNDTEEDLTGAASEARSYVENSKVSESLLLMKFYSLSSSVVNYLLSNRDGKELDLPFEVTDEELQIILFPRSTFVLGRSGTGKTTVLTMKLFERERLHLMLMERLHGVQNDSLLHGKQKSGVGEDVEETKRETLRQLFVTVSPKLCHAVKQHISNLKRSLYGENSSTESSSIDVEDIDDTVQFKDIPDSFVDVPSKAYPLVITFHKFLMMLDGTLGESYFERFHEARKLYGGEIRSLKSVILETFIRNNEVTYDKFSSLYWPHFNTQLTKKLDSSRVFTEIISYIKGGPRAMEASDGKLSREDYIQFSERRVSRLSTQKSEKVYDIFLNYEKMKTENGEFDLADLVIDLHLRLQEERYKGDKVDFVYIDEVQDLTMSQIALFKYICRNVEEGFIFSGDTAQTIARGIDFRFQEIRSLFYNKFLLESRSSIKDGRKEKGQLSDIFNLSHNFRTHAGVLKLSQSIMELLYHFFPNSVDVLNPETSLIYGEPPVLLESENNENAIISIFGSSGNIGHMAGFGAEQVILVRDDVSRKEIYSLVGKQALVLTILECKGLEFQDVLLYNFFGCSPLKNQWRVIYGYMREQNLLDSTSSHSFPSFTEAKHNVLCSELKQLYVAITRTRQRLWICENVEDHSKPMFDYWKKKCLIQVRQLDDSLAQAMQAGSSPEEWKSTGIKLFFEHNYEMATMCFEKAGDTIWERRSKAASLKANADRMRGSNPLEANKMLREAAEIFEDIGRADSAAKCFSELGEYERAGKIYLEKCGESELERAAECFSLAGCYELAADVYARGNFLAECLSACTKGKLFDRGLQYIHYWKQNAAAVYSLKLRTKEIENMEQEFLEHSARLYHQLKDNKSMMKFVKAFLSMDLIRDFLRSLGCLDELLSLEEESGNFLEAANIAKFTGNILLEADLQGKAGCFKKASTLILSYVLANSLWSSGSKGWPLKDVSQKRDLLAKAKSIAKNEPSHIYEFVCTEADIFACESNLHLLNQHLIASRIQNNVTGEILCARKILDAHLHSNSSKYSWDNEFVLDLVKHAEDRISENSISVETLVYFWNHWKDRIICIFNFLGCIEMQETKYRNYGEFCLSYLGVRKQIENLHTKYLLLNPDAFWVRELDDRILQRSGKLTFIDVRHLVSTARNYWCSELLSTGIKVLEHLGALHDLSVKNAMLIFHRSRCLAHIYEVAKFLLESEVLNRRYHDKKVLQKFLTLSTDNFFGYIFPLDWQESLNENMFSLRATEASRSLLSEIVLENIASGIKLTYGQIGRVAVVSLGSVTLNSDVREKVSRRFDGDSQWKAFMDTLFGNVISDVPHGSLPGTNNEVQSNISLLFRFCGALMETYGANWRSEDDYISPPCFMYLLESLLLMLSYYQGYFFSTKSSFVEWFMWQRDNTKQYFIVERDVKIPRERIFKFAVDVIMQLLQNKNDTIAWIRKSNIDAKGYRALVLRLVVMLCLLHVNFGHLLNLIVDLPGRNYITEQLPREFFDVLWPRRKRKNVDVNVLAEALQKIGNPLVIVSTGKDCSKFVCRDAIFVDLRANPCREDVIRILFPKKIKISESHTGAVDNEHPNSSRGGLCAESCDQGKHSTLPSSEIVSSVAEAQDHNELKLQMNFDRAWKMLEAFRADTEKSGPSAESFAVIKVNVEELTDLFAAMRSVCLQSTVYNKDKQLLAGIDCCLDELRLLLAAYLIEMEIGDNISTIRETYNRLLSMKQKVEPFLKLLQALNCDEKGNFKAEVPSNSDDSIMKALESGDTRKPGDGLLQQDGKTCDGALEAHDASGGQGDEEGNSKAEEPSVSGKSTGTAQKAVVDETENPGDKQKTDKKKANKKKKNKGKGGRKNK